MMAKNTNQILHRKLKIKQHEPPVFTTAYKLQISWFWLMVFNATFNNISVISWQSVLLVEETGVPGQNHRPVTSH
jgi:hypothetical protein